MHRRQLFLFGIIFLLSFVGFTVFVKYGYFSSIDFNTTVRLQHIIPKTLDTPFSLLSLIGSFEIISLILGIVLLVTTPLLTSMLLLATYMIAHVTELLGKLFLYHPGPPFMFFRYDLGFSFPSSYVQTGSSYPSGHSFRIVFVAVTFLFLIYRSTKLRPLSKTILTVSLAIFTFCMLVSRVSLGEHWVSDVIGGSLLGIAGSLFTGSLLMPFGQTRVQTGGPRIQSKRKSK